jgi:hypothetical protein
MDHERNKLLFSASFKYWINLWQFNDSINHIPSNGMVGVKWIENDVKGSGRCMPYQD